MIIRFQNSALFLIFCFLVSFILLPFLLIPFFPHSSFFSTFILLFFLKSDQIIFFFFHKLFLKSLFNFLQNVSIALFSNFQFYFQLSNLLYHFILIFFQKLNEKLKCFKIKYFSNIIILSLSTYVPNSSFYKSIFNLYYFQFFKVLFYLKIFYLFSFLSFSQLFF